MHVLAIKTLFATPYQIKSNQIKALHHPHNVIVLYSKMAQSQRILIALFALVAATAAFTQPSSSIGVSRYAPVAPVKPAAFSNSNVFENNAVGESKTMLMERRWNFNEARGPFGMKKNAEIWNGRVAQVSLSLSLYTFFLLVSISF